MKSTISQKFANIFYTKFRSFVHRTTVQKCAALCCIYLTYVTLTETQTSRTNFAAVQTVQKADFILKIIKCPIPSLLWCCYDVGVTTWFSLKKINIFFQYFKS